MKERPALAVGIVVVVAIVIVIAGALYLSVMKPVVGGRALHTARFASVGGMGVGIPVTVHGVQVGWVEAIRLGEDGWVEVDIRVDGGVPLPVRPAVIAAPTSLFGEWGAEIISLEHSPPDDPSVFIALESAEDPEGEMWPGTALPDIGYLTAQAGRIAGDISLLTERLGAAVDSSTADNIRNIITDFVQIAAQLRAFTVSQMESINAATGDVVAAAEAGAVASDHLQRLMARIDSVTSDQELEQLMTAATGTSADLRVVSSDLRSLVGTVRANESSLVNALVGMDSVMSRLADGRGSVGMAVRDSALYVETIGAVRDMRQLIADIQANPRRYFKFSVF